MHMNTQYILINTYVYLYYVDICIYAYLLGKIKYIANICIKILGLSSRPFTEV